MKPTESPAGLEEQKKCLLVLVVFCSVILGVAIISAVAKELFERRQWKTSSDDEEEQPSDKQCQKNDGCILLDKWNCQVLKKMHIFWRIL